MSERKWLDIDIMPNDDDRWVVIPPTQSGTSEPIGSEDGYATLAEAVAVAEVWAQQRGLHLPYLLTIQVAQDAAHYPEETTDGDECEEPARG